MAHAGPLGFTTVRRQRKPFGETVVVAHRLLKNDIPGHEYLLTEAVLAPGSHAGSAVPRGATRLGDLPGAG